MIIKDILAIPKSTPQAAPVIVTLRPVQRRVRRAWLRFPDGCAGLVGVRLLDRGSQFLPLSGWITSNADELAFNVGHVLEGDPFYVYALGYNVDDTYPHNIEVRLETER